jgi:NAD+ synthetase
VRGPLFEEAIVTADLELADIARVRAEQPLLADLETELPHLLRSVEVRDRVPAPYDPEDLCPRTHRPPAAAKHPVVTPPPVPDPLAVDATLVEQWLVAFLKDEVVRRRGYTKGIVGLSGGVDSALVALLAARALGPENVIGLRLPYKTSSPDSLEHAELVAKQTGIQLLTVDLTPAVDGYLEAADPKADPTRRGNVAARARMTALFDLSAKYQALPLGTSNKSERLTGYFTWHGDDAASVNPLGDLFKTQVWVVARHMGVPGAIVDKPATADLVPGQTDEADLGVPYARLDPILHYLLQGLSVDRIVGLGFSQDDVELVRRRLGSTHWKRRLPTVAMVSQTAVGEYYLRPVDY